MREVLDAALALPPAQQKVLRIALDQSSNEPDESWSIDELAPELQQELHEALAEATERRGEWIPADEVLKRLDRITANTSE